VQLYNGQAPRAARLVSGCAGQLLQHLVLGLGLCLLGKGSGCGLACCKAQGGWRIIADL